MQHVLKLLAVLGIQRGMKPLQLVAQLVAIWQAGSSAVEHFMVKLNEPAPAAPVQAQPEAAAATDLTNSQF